jgi:hypothetical protein
VTVTHLSRIVRCKQDKNKGAASPDQEYIRGDYMQSFTPS